MPHTQKRKVNIPRKGPLRIVPLGGCEEFGINITCYQMDGKFIVVDAGAVFPEAQNLGISTIIPYVKKTFREFGKLVSYVITHGHEDHIGALPFVYKVCPAPIYATPWTCELLKKKFIKYGITTKDINVVQCEEKVSCGPFNVEYVHMNHSIPDAASLFIRTAQGNAFHTGDFKIDRHPDNPHKINAKQVNQISQSGVDVLLTDSTNAYKEGFTPSEYDIKKPLEKIISSASGRVFIGTFSSNFWRLKTIFDLCKKLNKKLIVNGRSLQDCLDIAQRLGKIHEIEKTLVRIEQHRNYPHNKLVFLVSGTQGEERASLTRIAMKEHKQIKICDKDLIIFSARSIPGNEKKILNVIEHLKKQGAQVITAGGKHNIHVSGHAHSEDLKYLTKRLKPRLYVPVHGSLSFLNKNIEMVEKAFKDTKTLQLDNGDVLELKQGVYKTSRQKLHIERLYVDQDSHIPLKYHTLKERLDSGEHGYACVSGVISRTSRKWLKGPEIEFFGIEDKHAMIHSASKLSHQLKDQLKEEGSYTQDQYKEFCHSFLRKSLFKKYKKRAKVLSRIYLV